MIVPWTALDWPLDWDGRFGRQAPLCAELGFGDGEYLEHRAAEAPAENWVGIERSWTSVRRMLRRLDRSGLANVRIVQGDAAWLLEHIFPDASLSEIVVNHSDPWPKTRHHGRRLVQERFLSVAASRLRTGGRLTVVTDHSEYADWIASALSKTPELRSAFPTERVPAIPDRPPTRYERKGLAAGSTIHYFVWEKILDACPLPARVMRYEPMPNVVLHGRLPETFLDGLMSAASPLTLNDGSLRVQLLGSYRRTDGEEWLIEGRVDEDGFVQHLALSVVRRPGHHWLLKPSSIGFPRPTAGVRAAVHLLAAELVRRHPHLHVIASGVGELTQPRG